MTSDIHLPIHGGFLRCMVETDVHQAYVDGLNDPIVNRFMEVRHSAQTLQTVRSFIIENCLFGVDINPNSVKICQLRLWIELLKNAYYKTESNYTELETLPNIDINIKEGNSLISRFGVDTDLKSILISKKSQSDIKTYSLIFSI